MNPHNPLADKAINREELEQLDRILAETPASDLKLTPVSPEPSPSEKRAAARRRARRSRTR